MIKPRKNNVVSFYKQWDKQYRAVSKNLRRSRFIAFRLIDDPESDDWYEVETMGDISPSEIIHILEKHKFNILNDQDENDGDGDNGDDDGERAVGEN